MERCVPDWRRATEGKCAQTQTLSLSLAPSLSLSLPLSPSLFSLLLLTQLVPGLVPAKHDHGGNRKNTIHGSKPWPAVSERQSRDKISQKWMERSAFIGNQNFSLVTPGLLLKLELKAIILQRNDSARSREREQETSHPSLLSLSVLKYLCGSETCLLGDEGDPVDAVTDGCRK